MFYTETALSGIAVPEVVISPSWNGFLARVVVSGSFVKFASFTSAMPDFVMFFPGNVTKAIVSNLRMI